MGTFFYEKVMDVKGKNQDEKKQSRKIEMSTYYLLSVIDKHIVSWYSLSKYGHNHLLWFLIKFMPGGYI